MAKIKEGFRGERLVSLPEELLASYQGEPLISNLYVRKIGYFPRVKYHFVQKDKGCDYALLLYCTEGQGWLRIGDRRYEMKRDQYAILPPGTPYAFGADEEAPWTIYWLHFQGTLRDRFLPASPAPLPIEAGEHSRLQERIRLFEEIFASFSMGYIKDYMTYSSLCLYLFLGSFRYVEPFRHALAPTHPERAFSARVIHYMQEQVRHRLTLKELAAHFHYSPSQFSLLFQRETGFAPMGYFLRLKVQKACEYIELSPMKLSEIAFALGFEEVSYFSRLFSKVMGCSPSAYRKKNGI